MIFIGGSDVKRGRVCAKVLAEFHPRLSNRRLGDAMGISEGTVRNWLLYAKAADLCAGREGAPDEDAIAAMPVRQLRKLILLDHIKGS